jgi:hypothetical protein
MRGPVSLTVEADLHRSRLRHHVIDDVPLMQMDDAVPDLLETVRRFRVDSKFCGWSPRERRVSRPGHGHMYAECVA